MKRFTKEKFIFIQNTFLYGRESNMSKNYKQISEEILEHIGGKDNVVSAAHCATRLRLVLKDDKSYASF